MVARHKVKECLFEKDKSMKIEKVLVVLVNRQAGRQDGGGRCNPQHPCRLHHPSMCRAVRCGWRAINCVGGE